MFNDIIAGFSLLLSFSNIAGVFLGVAYGVFMGAIPGLTGTMGIALIIPLTYGMEPVTAFCILLGTYKGCLFGGSIPAILLNTPGTPAAAVTIFDGYPLAKKNQSGRAMDIALWSSVISDTFSTCCLIFLVVGLASIALKFGPVEYSSLIIFSMTIVASVSGETVVKGLLAACVGFLLATVGLDPFYSTTRFTFGSISLFNGISHMVLLIGLFAISEVLVQASLSGKPSSIDTVKTVGRASLADLKRCLRTIFRSSVIGIVLGAIPGLGATPAAFLSYNEAKRKSKTPEEFGKGSVEGVAASESGNNATCGGALIPLMALGVPGDVTTAVLLGAFMIHGLTPGPTLFKEEITLVYAIFGGLLIAIFALFFIGKQAVKAFAKISKLPASLVYPVTAILCTAGVFGFNSSFTDLWVMLLFGVVAYIMRLLNYPLAPLIIAFILEPIGERSIRQSLTLSDGSVFIFLQKPISVLFLTLTVISIFLVIRMNKRQKQREAEHLDTKLSC